MLTGSPGHSQAQEPAVDWSPTPLSPRALSKHPHQSLPLPTTHRGSLLPLKVDSCPCRPCRPTPTAQCSRLPCPCSSQSHNPASFSHPRVQPLQGAFCLHDPPCPSGSCYSPFKINSSKKQSQVPGLGSTPILGPQIHALAPYRMWSVTIQGRGSFCPVSNTGQIKGSCSWLFIEDQVTKFPDLSTHPHQNIGKENEVFIDKYVMIKLNNRSSGNKSSEKIATSVHLGLYLSASTSWPLALGLYLLAACIGG